MSPFIDPESMQDRPPRKYKHGWWIMPSFLGGAFLCLIAFLPHLVRNGIAAASLLLAVFVLALIGAGVALWLVGR